MLLGRMDSAWGVDMMGALNGLPKRSIFMDQLTREVVLKSGDEEIRISETDLLNVGVKRILDCADLNNERGDFSSNRSCLK